MIDFPGRLAAVFFISGCTFSCGFCHNAQLMARRREVISWPKLESVCEGFRRHWVDAAVITGGEPTTAPDLVDLIGFFRHFGWAVKLDTNGSDPAALKDCLPLVDYVAMDIKAGLSGYPALTGFAAVDRIAQSVDLVLEYASDYEFRTTVIEPFHTDAQMEEIGSMIDGAKRYVMQPFVPREGLPNPSFEATPRTSGVRLDGLRNMMENHASEVTIRA